MSSDSQETSCRKSDPENGRNSPYAREREDPQKNRLEKGSGRNGNRPPKIGSGKVLKFPHTREKWKLRKEAKLFFTDRATLIISGGGVDQDSIFVYFRPANEKNPQKVGSNCKILAKWWQNGGNDTEVDLGYNERLAGSWQEVGTSLAWSWHGGVDQGAKNIPFYRKLRLRKVTECYRLLLTVIFGITTGGTEADRSSMSMGIKWGCNGVGMELEKVGLTKD